MKELESLFINKITENGDTSFNTTRDNLLDILFMSAYYEKHLEEVSIGDSKKEQIFAMFMRDGRYGIGRRDLGRVLMEQSKVPYDLRVKAGRYDDLLYPLTDASATLLLLEVSNGNHLAKKWCPRLTGKNKAKAKQICNYWGVTEKGYRSLIKTDTVESKLTNKDTESIDFEQVPSLAMIKYWNRFKNGEDTSSRFNEYLDSVDRGEKKINVATTTVYDIYMNRMDVSADLLFRQLPKIKISCLPILDSSLSMYDRNDSMGKATSIAHYLAKCSTYCNNQVVAISRDPRLITMQESTYVNQVKEIQTGEVANTDFGKVLDLLQGLKEDLPDYIVCLSDMEFDQGSNQSKEDLQALWAERGVTTKIVWWNFNTRNTTVPEIDEMGNIFISGYNPQLLQFLEAGFDGQAFLNRLLIEYQAKLKI